MGAVNGRRSQGERVSAASGRRVAADSEHRDSAEQLPPAGHRDVLRVRAELAESVGEREVLRRHQADAAEAQTLGR